MERNFILSVGMSVMFFFISSIKTVQAQQLGIGVKTELNGKYVSAITMRLILCQIQILV